MGRCSTNPREVATESCDQCFRCGTKGVNMMATSIDIIVLHYDTTRMISTDYYYCLYVLMRLHSGNSLSYVFVRILSYTVTLLFWSFAG